MRAKIFILAMAALISITAAYAGEAQLSETYCKMPHPGCGLEDQFYLDAPWRASGEFPVYAVVNTGMDELIKYVKIYDANSGKLTAVRDFGNFAVKKESQPYFFEFNINAENLQKDRKGEVSLKAVFGAKFGIEYENQEGPVKVWISENFPELENWWAGDLHYHTNYSRNIVEFGASFAETKKAAREIGLDFIAITDHSFAVKREEWPQIIRLAGENTDKDFVFIPGEEVSTNDGIEKYRHFLAIGISEFIPGDEIEANLGATFLTPEELVRNVNAQGGTGYVAHPFYGDAFRMGWEQDDYNLPFHGLQIWNHGSYKNDFSEFQKGLEKWRELLANRRKVFIGAGSDAHGDFQILGRARTYAYTEDFSQRGILDALKKGNTFITDGPLLTFSINEAILGQEAMVEAGTKPQLRIKFTSNKDFRKLIEIEIWRGDEIADVLKPDSYFNPGHIWTDKFIATETYYRLVGKTELGYTAYTNPIWTKPFSKPKKEIAAKTKEKIVETVKKFVSPIISMPSIIIKILHNPIHDLSPEEIVERYKTDEQRKIDKITSEALKKMNSSNEPSIFEQKYSKSGKISGKEAEETGKEQRNYTVERYGGKVYYPN